MTWHVVHAHDFSHACSTSMPCSSRLSSTETPVAASNVLPSGQISACGRTTISGIVSAPVHAMFMNERGRKSSERIDAPPRECARHAAVHPPRREAGGRLVQRFHGGRERITV